MSRTYKDSPQSRRQPRRISVRAVRRDPPDLRAMRRALVEQALAAAAAEAEAAEPEPPVEDSNPPRPADD